jgi:hypothetical protein
METFFSIDQINAQSNGNLAKYFSVLTRRGRRALFVCVIKVRNLTTEIPHFFRTLPPPPPADPHLDLPRRIQIRR